MKSLLGLFLFSGIAFSQVETRIKIAVIDTGISIEQEDMRYMCKDGVKNFTSSPRYDINGHGSHIVHIIGSRIDSNKYCIVSYKVFDDKMFFDADIKSLQEIALDENIKFLNISMSGSGEYPDEFKLLNKIAEKEVKITIAAGNDKAFMSKNNCNYYPSCYKFKISKPNNLYIVGAINTDFSNYGPAVDITTEGVVASIGGIKRGTSQASAMAMARIVNESK